LQRSAEANIFVLNSVGISDFNSKAALFIISSERALVLNFLPLQDEKFQTLHHEILFLAIYQSRLCRNRFANTISAKTRNVLRCFIMICLGLIFYNKYSKI
jgi:hypothetical protein